MKNLENIKESLMPYVEEYGIVKAAVFGSYARNEERENSDIDLLLEFSKSFDLIRLIHLKNMLEDKLKTKVDIVEYCSLNQLIREQVLKEAVTILPSQESTYGYSQ